MGTEPLGAPGSAEAERASFQHPVKEVLGFSSVVNNCFNNKSILIDHEIQLQVQNFTVNRNDKEGILSL